MANATALVADLAEVYRFFGTTVDQLAVDPERLSLLAAEFNRRTGSSLSGPEILKALFNARKRGSLPRLHRRCAS